MAEERKLWGETASITTGTVNSPATRNTKIFAVWLITNSNIRKLIRAFDVETISSEVKYIELNGFKHKYSQDIQNQWKQVQTPRPVHRLIRAEEAGLHPNHLETR
jgi:hypothetical protein